MSVKDFLNVGRIVGTRGLQGELKIQVFCDTPQIFCEIPNLYFYAEDNKKNKINILKRRIFKNIVLMKIDGIQEIAECKSLIGENIYAYKEEISLPANRYFIEDIIGIDVVDADTFEKYGKLSDIIQTGANDVYCVKDDTSKEYLLPAVKDIIVDINLDKNILFVRPIEGIFYA